VIDLTDHVQGLFLDRRGRRVSAAPLVRPLFQLAAPGLRFSNCKSSFVVGAFLGKNLRTLSDERVSQDNQRPLFGISIWILLNRSASLPCLSTHVYFPVCLSQKLNSVSELISIVNKHISCQFSLPSCRFFPPETSQRRSSFRSPSHCSGTASVPPVALCICTFYSSSAWFDACIVHFGHFLPFLSTLRLRAPRIRGTNLVFYTLRI
jgi:hypothetical protein